METASHVAQQIIIIVTSSKSAIRVPTTCHTVPTVIIPIKNIFSSLSHNIQRKNKYRITDNLMGSHKLDLFAIRAASSEHGNEPACLIKMRIIYCLTISFSRRTLDPRSSVT